MSLDRLKSTWEELGKADPLWAVLTDPDRRHGGWDVDEFMATARTPVETAHRQLTDAGLSFGDRVLDFGCGAGRLSNAVADYAAEVVGIDIAASMVEEANRINRHPQRVSFVHYDGTRLPFPDAAFDSVISLISLQHSPAAVQLAILIELNRVVRPGGALVLQMPTRPARPPELDQAGMRARIEADVPTSFVAGAVTGITARATNVSDHVWPAGQLIRLGNHWYTDDVVIRWNDGRTDLPRDVAPGETVSFEIQVTAPDAPGTYALEFDLVQEAVTWWAEVGSTPHRVLATVTDTAPAPVAPAPEITETGVPERREDGGMEMHGVDETLVRLLFAHCGSTVVATVPDRMAGPEWESNTYIVQRGREL